MALVFVLSAPTRSSIHRFFSHSPGCLGDLPVNLRDDEGNVGVHAERGAVINDHSASLRGNLLSVGEGKIAVDGKENNVALASGVDVKELNGDLTELGVHLRALRAGGTKNSKLVRQAAGVLAVLRKLLVVLAAVNVKYRFLGTLQNRPKLWPYVAILCTRGRCERGSRAAL